MLAGLVSPEFSITGEVLVEKWGPGPTTSTNYQAWESVTLEMELLASDKFWENSSNWRLTAIDRCPRKSPQPSSYKVRTHRIFEHNKWLFVTIKSGLIFCITLDNWNRLNVTSIAEIHGFLKLWSLLYLKITNFFLCFKGTDLLYPEYFPVFYFSMCLKIFFISPFSPSLSLSHLFFSLFSSSIY